MLRVRKVIFKVTFESTEKNLFPARDVGRGLSVCALGEEAAFFVLDVRRRRGVKSRK